MEHWHKFKGGDKKALAFIFKSYYSDLKAYGLKLTANEEMTKEAIQILFLKLWEKKNNLPDVHSPKAYLITTFRRTLIDLLRIEKKDSAFKKEFSFHFSEKEWPVLNFTPTDNKELTKLINQLNPKQKEIIYLKFYNKLSYLEIAEALDINYQTVRNYMTKAIKFLRNHLKL